MSRSTGTKDWSAAQYLKFEAERTRPSRDLLAQIPLRSPKRAVDLGCGPGNSTAVVAAAYPDAQVTGMDSSPDMIAKAKATMPDLSFELADLHSYTPPAGTDLLFSNAVFQWVPFDDRVPIITKLMHSLPSGGVFAFQVPDNHREPTHMAMKALATEPGRPWTATLGALRPGVGPFQTPQELYDQIGPLCESVNVWHTYYQHVLEGHEAVVEWVKGTGLRPFVDPLGPLEREAFLKEYLERVRAVYPTSYDGKVLLRYPRLFMVAVKA